MNIPLVDLNAQYAAIRPEIDAAMQRVLARSAFIGGEDHRQFETEFAAYCEAKACAGVGNCTDALYLTLRALGIGPGHEVITVAHTFIATAEAISLTGAQPVFVDVREDTMQMDADSLPAAITSRTRAVIPVHLYGQPCQMDRILEIARHYRLKVIEDAAQAHGARWQGQRVGTLGDAGCFSFYPGKNLGAYGDAGAVVSQDEKLVRRVRMLANHGRLEKFNHEIEGVNSRLDGLQAAVLRVKLRYLDQWNEARRRHAARYLEGLRGAGLILPVTHPSAAPVWHMFVIRVPDRERLQAHLKEWGIATGIHYPLPLHLQPAYRHLEIPKGALPVTERLADEVISLPMYPELSDAMVSHVVGAVRSALSGPVLREEGLAAALFGRDDERIA
jgi:dTDP-4-amino-4,6-dideoxygalactose transaminase